MGAQSTLYMYLWMYREKNEIKRLDRFYAEKTAQFNELLDVAMCVLHYCFKG